jgi:hypothetical protein
MIRKGTRVIAKFSNGHEREGVALGPMLRWDRNFYRVEFLTEAGNPIRFSFDASDVRRADGK